jgi:hypothetical protein
MSARLNAVTVARGRRTPSVACKLVLLYWCAAFVGATSALLVEAATPIYQCTQADGSESYQARCPAGSRSLQIQLAPLTPIDTEIDTGPPDAGAQLLKNPAFEQGASHWDMRGPVDVANATGLQGSRALVLQAPVDGDISRARQCLPAEGLGAVGVSALIKPPDGRAEPDADTEQAQDQLRLVFFASRDCTGDGEYGAKLAPTSSPGWQKLQSAPATPMLGAQSMMVELAKLRASSASVATASAAQEKHPKTPAANATLWDDIQLLLVTRGQVKRSARQGIAAQAGQNLVQNGQFDAQTSGWQLKAAHEWHAFFGEGLTAGLAVQLAQNYPQAQEQEALSQCINLAQPGTYEARASFKPDPLSSQAGHIRFEVILFQGLDCQGPSRIGSRSQIPVGLNQGEPQQVAPAQNIPQDSTAQWQQASLTVEAPAEAYSASVRSLQHINSNGVLRVFWDNIYFGLTNTPAP